MWYALFPIYQQSVKKGGIPLHSAMIAHEDRAFVLIGPGNAGKSTSCKLLPSSWEALCDDEVLVVNSKEHNFCVHPFPTWSDLIVRQQHDKSWPVKKAEKLYAVVFLEKSHQNRLIPVSTLYASAKIFQSSYDVYRKFLTLCPPDTKREIILLLFDNAVRMAHKIPAFRLSFSIDGGYWKLLERI